MFARILKEPTSYEMRATKTAICYLILPRAMHVPQSDPRLKVWEKRVIDAMPPLMRFRFKCLVKDKKLKALAASLNVEDCAKSLDLPLFDAMVAAR